jgi:hypothetical protein
MQNRIYIAKGAIRIIKYWRYRCRIECDLGFFRIDGRIGPDWKPRQSLRLEADNVGDSDAKQRRKED